MERKRYIGGSDAGAILGVSPWKNVIQVWLEKTGDSKPQKESPAMYWGTKLEKTIIDEFCEQTGMKVTDTQKEYALDDMPYVAGNIDAIVSDGAGLYVLECKTASFFAKSEWEDGEAPAHYLAQVQHYLMISGLKKAFIAVLIGGQDFRIVEVEADENLHAGMKRIYRNFWETYVIPNRCPPLEDADAETLALLYPKSTGKELTLEIVNPAKEYLQISAEIDALKVKQDSAKAHICGLMLDAEAAISNDGKYAATWKTQTTERLDTLAFKVAEPETYKKYLKKSTSRVFRVKEVKIKAIN